MNKAEPTWEEIEEVFGMPREHCMAMMQMPPEVLDTWMKMRIAIARGELKAEKIGGFLQVKPAEALRWAVKNGIKVAPQLLRAAIKHGTFDDKA